MPATHSIICRSLLAGDSTRTPAAHILNRLQAGSYTPIRSFVRMLPFFVAAVLRRLASSVTTAATSIHPDSGSLTTNFTNEHEWFGHKTGLKKEIIHSLNGVMQSAPTSAFSVFIRSHWCNSWSTPIELFRIHSP
jgi:hypothetical protein